MYSVQQLTKLFIVYLDIESFYQFQPLISLAFINASKSDLHLFRLLHAQAHTMHHLPTTVYLDIHDFTNLNNRVSNTISKLTSNHKDAEILLQLLSHVTLPKIRIVSYTLAANNSTTNGLILQVQQFSWLIHLQTLLFLKMIDSTDYIVLAITV